MTKGIYNRLPLIYCPVLDIDIALYKGIYNRLPLIRGFDG